MTTSIRDAEEPKKPIGNTPEGDKIPLLPDRPDIEGELWRDEVDLNHLSPHGRSKVFGVLGFHLSMWDGRLGHVHSATLRIQLVPRAKLVQLNPIVQDPVEGKTSHRKCSVC
jgi:hypothetical protein